MAIRIHRTDVKSDTVGPASIIIHSTLLYIGKKGVGKAAHAETEKLLVQPLLAEDG